MSKRSLRHGPSLPYTLIAGVVPNQAGWLVASGKLQGATLAPETPRLLGAFADVLDDRPRFSVVALFAPVGLLDKPEPGGRLCDRAARAVLGPRRGAAIRSAPSWLAMNGDDEADTVGLDAVTTALLPRYAEVAREMAPYRQRTVFEVHPELTFYQLNDDHPLQHGKQTRAGHAERRLLLQRKFPGVERILDGSTPGVRDTQLVDGLACLWTARRIVAKAIARLPEDPVWDSQGLRMEIIR